MKNLVLFGFLFVCLFIFLISGSSWGDSPEKALPRGTPTIGHPGRPVEEPKAGHSGEAITAAIVKEAIRNHVKGMLKAGVFTIRDDKLNRQWGLKLAKIHDPVRSFEKEGKPLYFACTDFASVDSKDILDIDFWMAAKEGKLEVIETKIHKLNGKPRYTFEGITLKEIK